MCAARPMDAGFLYHVGASVKGTRMTATKRPRARKTVEYTPLIDGFDPEQERKSAESAGRKSALNTKTKSKKSPGGASDTAQVENNCDDEVIGVRVERPRAVSAGTPPYHNLPPYPDIPPLAPATPALYVSTDMLTITLADPRDTVPVPDLGLFVRLTPDLTRDIHRQIAAAWPTMPAATRLEVLDRWGDIEAWAVAKGWTLDA